jgi:hypothetical protein
VPHFVEQVAVLVEEIRHFKPDPEALVDNK